MPQRLQRDPRLKVRVLVHEYFRRNSVPGKVILAPFPCWSQETIIRESVMCDSSIGHEESEGTFPSLRGNWHIPLSVCVWPCYDLPRLQARHHQFPPARSIS